MSNIDRPGSFRGDIIDRGVGETKNGFPQLVLQLKATEHYNEENEVWEAWPYDECEATAYMVLFGKNGKPTLGVSQAQKALGWDGASFSSLETDTTVEQIQWRMENNTYEGTTRIQVGWIDAYDSEPGRKVRKLDPADVRKLDAKFSAALKAIGGGPKPKSAPPRPATPKETPAADPTLVMPAPLASAAPAAISTPVSADEPPFTPDPPTEAAPEPEKPKRGRKPAVPAAPAAPAPTAAVVDQAAAWNAVYTAGKASSKSDKDITNAWIAEVNTRGGDEAIGADWSGVQSVVVKNLS